MSFFSGIPNWVKVLAILVIVIIIAVVAKVNFSGHIGSEGIGVNLTQGLVK
jgi:hypothetical protein